MKREPLRWERVSTRPRTVPRDFVACGGGGRRGGRDGRNEDHIVVGGFEDDAVLFVGNLGEVTHDPEEEPSLFGFATSPLSDGCEVTLVHFGDLRDRVVVERLSTGCDGSGSVVETRENPSDVSGLVLLQRMHAAPKATERVRQLLHRQLAIEAERHGIADHTQRRTHGL